MSDNKPRALQVAAYRYNCQPCKQRKTKCDRVRPCASCQLRGTQDRCYTDEEGHAPQELETGGYEGAATVARGASGMARGREEERPVKRARVSQPQASPSEAHVGTGLGRDDAIREHIATLRKTIGLLEASIDPSASQATNDSKRASSSGSRYTSSYEPSNPTLVRDMRLTWTDVAHLFPPQQDVERLLEYFLEDMVFIMIPIQEKQLWPAWLRLIQSPSSPSGPLDEDAEEERWQGQGISRCMVGSLLMCLVSVSFLIPERREEQLRLTRPTAEQRDAWITAAMALVRSGTILSSPSSSRSQQWLHYATSTHDTSLDRFGFEVLCTRIFSLLGMGEVAYHINGETLRRATSINLYDESRPANIPYDESDPYLTPECMVQMRRRIGKAIVVYERWFSMYAGTPPMVDDEAEQLPAPDKGFWKELEEVPYAFSQCVSKIRKLSAHLTVLTAARKRGGDWATQRARDQEAVQRVLDVDKALCSAYDPAAPRETLGGSSHEDILADLPKLMATEEYAQMSTRQRSVLHREFAEAIMMCSTWLSLRLLATSNLMFLPWVGGGEGAEAGGGLRYRALNLARRILELLPSIWMMASSDHVPFSSSWISRHLFLACTVLSMPILSAQSPPNTTSASAERDHPQGSSDQSPGGRPSVFAPSKLHNSSFLKMPPSTSKILDNARAPATSSSPSVDMDWFSGKLVEISSLFSRLAERGDQTSIINSKLIHALLNSRSELRDRVFNKIGQKTRDARGGAGAGEEEEEVGRIESQKDLTSFVLASSIGKPSPTGGSVGRPSPSNSSPGDYGTTVSSPLAAGGYKAKGRTPNARGNASRGMGREDLVANEANEGRVQSPSLHDLANAVDTHTAPTHPSSSNVGGSGSWGMPPPPSRTPHSHPYHHQHQYQQHQQQQSSYAYPSSTTHSASSSAPAGSVSASAAATATADETAGWIYQNTQLSHPSSFFPSSNTSGSSWDNSDVSTPMSGDGTGDVLANVPMLLDTQDWLAILDGVDIPL